MIPQHEIESAERTCRELDERESGITNHERSTQEGYTTAYLDALRLAAQDALDEGMRVDYLLEHRPGGSLFRAWCTHTDFVTIQHVPGVRSERRN